MTEWLPVVRLDDEYVATPPTVDFSTGVPPSTLNRTGPVGTPAAAVTVAVNVTGLPTATVAADVTSVSVVGSIV